MPKRLLILNVLLGGVCLFCLAVIVQQLVWSPSPPAGRPRRATPAGGPAAAVPAQPHPPVSAVAYLEDPLTKRVAGYRIGDTIAGGRVEAITADHVIISRPDGNLDVRLRDPSKPRPAPAPPPGQPGVPGQPPMPGAPMPPMTTPPVPLPVPVPPRALPPQQPVPPFQGQPMNPLIPGRRPSPSLGNRLPLPPASQGIQQPPQSEQ